MMKTTHAKTWLGAASLVLLPVPAQANAGVPMLFLVMPAFAMAILPIIAIEALYLAKRLHLPRLTAAKTAALSNMVSTVIGIPLTWFGLVVAQMVTGGGRAYGINSLPGKLMAVTWQAPWLIPYESELHWMVPAAGAFLLIPFFLVSWWSEYHVVKKRHRDRGKALIRIAVRNANLVTYGLLTLWPIAMLLFPEQ